MISKNEWKPELYDEKLGIVTDLGKGILELLNPKAGEKILDVGCGTGHLTNELYQRGAKVIGIDVSKEMINEAKTVYPQIDFFVSDAAKFQSLEKFDAVFSNAALHWIRDAEGVVQSMNELLRSGGRFVVEFGGEGNIGQLIKAMENVFQDTFGIDFSPRNPWYFPSVGTYCTLLEQHGFRVELAHHFDRPTVLPDGDEGLDHWMNNFGDDFFFDFSESDKQIALAKIKQEIRTELFIDDAWVIDYKRLRIIAVKK